MIDLGWRRVTLLLTSTWKGRLVINFNRKNKRRKTTKGLNRKELQVKASIDGGGELFHAGYTYEYYV